MLTIVNFNETNMKHLWKREVNPEIGVMVEVHRKTLVNESGEFLPKILEFQV